MIEIDLESDGEIEILAVRKLEDEIHRIVVRRSAPDWLPFRPGSSYWVPPRRRTHGIAEFVGRIANPLSEDETLSLTSDRGWPSSSYFRRGTTRERPAKTKSMKIIAESEDEEG